MEEEFYFVDFKNVGCDKDVHEARRDGLHFTDYCGADSGALWDRLTDMMNYRAVITLQNFGQLEKFDAAGGAKHKNIYFTTRHPGRNPLTSPNILL